MPDYGGAMFFMRSAWERRFRFDAEWEARCWDSPESMQDYALKLAGIPDAF